MNFSIEKLTKEYLPMIESFSCDEEVELLKDYNAKPRRRILKRSKEMEIFLKEKAFHDQEEGLSTTHLFIDEEAQKIVAYVSLCNDSIRLASGEREEMKLMYTTIPALKIARLAVATEYQRKGVGKLLIRFAASVAKSIKEMSGIVFITLDCYEHRVPFYETIGFVRNVIQLTNTLYDSPISMRIGLEDYWKRIETD